EHDVPAPRVLLGRPAPRLDPAAPARAARAGARRHEIHSARVLAEALGREGVRRTDVEHVLSLDELLDVDRERELRVLAVDSVLTHSRDSSSAPPEPSAIATRARAPFWIAPLSREPRAREAGLYPGRGSEVNATGASRLRTRLRTRLRPRLRSRLR